MAPHGLRVKSSLVMLDTSSREMHVLQMFSTVQPDQFRDDGQPIMLVRLHMEVGFWQNEGVDLIEMEIMLYTMQKFGVIIEP